MKRTFVASSLLLFLAAGLAACGSSSDTARPETQLNFGVRMARQNLWREAMFRFKRAVELAPEDAQAHNNLAVAYEANGDFEAAEKSYRTAMRLDKSNTYIQKNYSRLVEFNSRNRKRQSKTAVSPALTDPTNTSEPAAPTPPSPPTTTAPPPPPPATATSTGGDR